MKLSAVIAVVGIVVGAAGAGGRAAAQGGAAPSSDRYGGASPYGRLEQQSALPANNSLPPYGSAAVAAGPTAMAPNPLRPNSAAASTYDAAADAAPAAASTDVHALHFDGRVEPAAASEPAAPTSTYPTTTPAELAVSDALPAAAADEAADIPATVGAADPQSPAAAGLEFTLPPESAAPAEIAAPPVEYMEYGAAETPAPVAASEPANFGGAFAFDADADGGESRRLAPAGADRSGTASSETPARRSLLPVSFSQLDGLSTAGAGLAVVVGLFLVCTWMVRRAGPKPTSVLPGDAFAVLGRAPLTAKSFVQMLRVGNKLVLVAVSADGAQPLTEVTDPDEVDRIVGLCHGSRAGGHSAEFQQVLAQLSKEPARGFLGREGSAARRRTA